MCLAAAKDRCEDVGMLAIRVVSVIALLFVMSADAIGQQRLLIVGEGSRPPEAVKKFVEWSGGQNARILIVTLATAEPEASFQGLKASLLPYAPASIDHAATRPLDGDKRLKFIAELSEATAVFFSGGDQNRTTEVLKDKKLLKLLRAKYAAGAPFGGISGSSSDSCCTFSSLRLHCRNRHGIYDILGLAAT